MKITKLTAFIACHPVNGTEGLIAAGVGKERFALVCSDDKLIPKMYFLAKEECKSHGYKLKVLQFTNSEDITSLLDGKYKLK